MTAMVEIILAKGCSTAYTFGWEATLLSGRLERRLTGTAPGCAPPFSLYIPSKAASARITIHLSAKSLSSYSGPAPLSQASLIGRLLSAFELLAKGGTAVDVRGAGGGSSGPLRMGAADSIRNEVHAV